MQLSELMKATKLIKDLEHPANRASGIEIDGAPAEPGYWFLWRVGRIRAESSTTFSIFCSFVKVESNGTYEKDAIYRSGWIDLGAFPLCPTGTIFENRRPIGFNSRLYQEEIELDTERQEILVDPGTQSRGILTHLSSEHHAGAEGISHGYTRVAIFEMRRDRLARHEAVIVNAADLVRFNIVFSSEMAHALFSEPYKHRMYHKHNTGFVDNDTFIISPKPGYSHKAFAQSLSMILANEDILKIWEEAGRYYTVDQINADRNWPKKSTILRCQWPRKSSLISVLGRNKTTRIRQSNITGNSEIKAHRDFEVLTILSDDRKSPFTKLIINSPTKQSKPEERNEDNVEEVPIRKNTETRPILLNKKIGRGGGGSSTAPPYTISGENILDKFPAFEKVSVVEKFDSNSAEVILVSTTQSKPLNEMRTGPPEGDSPHQNTRVRPKEIKDRPHRGPLENAVKNPIAGESLFHNAQATFFDSSRLKKAELENPISMAFIAASSLKSGRLTKIGFSRDFAQDINLLHLDKTWGHRAVINRVHSRRAFVGEISCYHGYFYVFELEAKTQHHQCFLCCKRDRSLLAEKEAAAILKTWCKSRKGEFSTMWPNHERYNDIIGIGLSHTLYRLTNPAIVANLIDDFIQMFKRNL